MTAKRNCLPYLVYSLLSLGVLGALLLPGYILTLDMVFAPHASISHQFYGLDEWRLAASTPLWLLIDAAAKVFPAWVWQKAILFSIFFLAGLGAHRLFPFRGIGSYFAGVLYMINPFTYVRFLAGQWGVLGAYAMTPFAIKAFLDLLERGSVKQAVKVALLSTLVGMFQIHGFLLLFLAFLVIFLVKLVRERRERAANIRACKFVTVAGVMFLALNSYWMLPALTSEETLLGQIGRGDLLLFAPKATSGFGTMFDLAAMYGFWRGGYTYAKDLLPLWWLGFAFIFYLGACGFVYSVRGRRAGRLVWSFGLIWLVGLILASGASIQFSRPAFEWLFDHLFFLRGFRDSQKFVALLCLSYSYLGGLGVYQLARWRAEHQQKGLTLYRGAVLGVIVLALVVPLVYSYPMFGFHGQLKPTDYPQEWYEVNDHLNEDEDDFNVLILPWHMYMDYSWLPNKDKRLMNPAQRFFDKPAICGDNIEVGSIYSQSTNPTSNYVDFVLENGDAIENLGELLAPLNVKYVVLLHEADYEEYGFLAQQRDLEVELEKGSLTLFKNQHSTARAYGVDSVIHISTLEEYVELSVEQDVMHHVYILGAGESDSDSTGMQPLAVVQRRPTRYEVEGNEKRWTVLTVPQTVSGDHWQFEGSRAAKNLGIMPVFEVGENGGVVTYSRFYNVYLPGYIVSSLAFVILVIVYLLAARRTLRQQYTPVQESPLLTKLR